MPVGFTGPFAERLNSKSPLWIKEGEPGEEIEKGKVIIAPGGKHLVVDRDRKIMLNTEPPIHGVRPAVDPMLESVGKVFREDSLGVILTGMGKDGAVGLQTLKRYGGKTIAQDEETSVVFGMPRAAISTGCVDYILPLESIPEHIIRLVRG